MKRLSVYGMLAGALWVAGLSPGAMARDDNLPVAAEALRGKVWHGGECCGWTWDWVLQSDATFRGDFKNKNGETLVEPKIQVAISGKTVTITRGAGSAGGGCTYVGRIWVGGAEGTYSCRGKPAGQWAATIYQTAPH